MSSDPELRAAAFAFLDDLTSSYGDRIPWKLLQRFEYAGHRRALITQRGIRWLSGQPAVTFTTTFSPDPNSAPYADHVGTDGFPRYKYQGTDPARPDNVAMKLAQTLEVPLAWLVGTGPGVYSATYPVYVVGHSDELLEFTIAVDEEQRALFDEPRLDDLTKRRYAMTFTELRLHQRIFRTIVMRAYQGRCSVCRLAHEPLLDAAHILADAEGGEPVVTNGIAMCKIHHAAYDSAIMSVTPDYRVAIKADVLLEVDGPMLQHGLQEMHGASIQLPRSRRERPDRDALARRHAAFLAR